MQKKFCRLIGQKVCLRGSWKFVGHFHKIPKWNWFWRHLVAAKWEYEAWISWSRFCYMICTTNHLQPYFRSTSGLAFIFLNLYLCISFGPKIAPEDRFFGQKCFFISGHLLPVHINCHKLILSPPSGHKWWYAACILSNRLCFLNGSQLSNNGRYTSGLQSWLDELELSVIHASMEFFNF